MLRQGLLRLRERMVLGPLCGHLQAAETINAWAHVVDATGRGGVLTVTEKRCLVHCGPPGSEPVTIAATELDAWRLESVHPTVVELALETEPERVVFQLPLTTHGQARKASEVVRELASWDPGVERAQPPVLTSSRLGLRGHVRRVVVTLVGVVLMLLSALFASPFFPGPGALTFLLALALLAREYDWARDVHVWTRRRFEQLWAWLQQRREQRRERRAASQES